MLSRKEITIVVTAAISRYASENGGKRGLSKEDVIDIVAGFGGDAGDVRLAMVEGLKRIMPNNYIYVR